MGADQALPFSDLESDVIPVRDVTHWGMHIQTQGRGVESQVVGMDGLRFKRKNYTA